MKITNLEKFEEWYKNTVKEDRQKLINEDFINEIVSKALATESYNFEVYDINSKKSVTETYDFEIVLEELKDEDGDIISYNVSNIIF